MNIVWLLQVVAIFCAGVVCGFVLRGPSRPVEIGNERCEGCAADLPDDGRHVTDDDVLLCGDCYFAIPMSGSTKERS